MKLITVLSLLLLTSPVFGELTKEDLRTIIKEEMAASEKRTREYLDLKVEYLDLKIDALDKKLNGRIDAVDKKLNAKIDALDKSLNAKIDAVDENLNGRIGDLRLWVIALIGLITAAIAIPQIIIAYRDRGQKEIRAELEQLRKQIELIGNTSV